MIRCPECHNLVNENLKECSVCGYPFMGQEEKVEVKTCPECGDITEFMSEICNNCGYPFEEDIQPEDEENDQNAKNGDEIVTALYESENSTGIINEVPNVFEENRDENKVLRMEQDSDVEIDEISNVTNIHPRWKKRSKIVLGLGAILLLGIIIFAATGDLRLYFKAKGLMKDGKYVEAIAEFKELDDYKDSEELIPKCNYEYGLKLIDSGDFDDAMKRLDLAGTGAEVKEAKNKCTYEKAITLAEKKEYQEAIKIFSELDYEDSKERLEEVKYNYASEFLEEGKHSDALILLEGLSYKDSEELVKGCKYNIGKKLYDEEKYDQALPYLNDLNYEDSNALTENINNNPYSLDKFVERYNNMVDRLIESENIVIDKISVSMFTDSKITLKSGAKVSFNNRDSGANYKNKITNINYFLDNEPSSTDVVLAESIATFAGFAPNSTLDEVLSILNEILSGEGSATHDGIEYANYSFYGMIVFRADIL